MKKFPGIIKKNHQIITPILFIFSLLLAPQDMPGQVGKLLVIGGGGEKLAENSWERIPYKWAVDQSANKRVALVSYYEQTSVIPEYFMNELGATYAKNFTIGNRVVADDPGIYDSLVTYDVIFIKGGDQYNYYSTYNDTRTEQAIMDKYATGGVICGTSAGLAVLGGVDYVAANASADPFDAIMDPLNNDITLENDFLPLLPGVLFDSHFAERGRFGRLLGFLARWQLDHAEAITGIGVDDMTALAFPGDGTFTVYGTGAANVYTAGGPGTFKLRQGNLSADSVHVRQMLHGWTYHLETGTVSTENTGTPSLLPGAFLPSTIYTSGGDDEGDNQAMLDAFLAENNGPTDPILVLTRPVGSDAEAITAYLREAGATHITIAGISLAMTDDQELGDQISSTGKFIFADLNIQEMMSFMAGGKNGSALAEKLRQSSTVSAFIGRMSCLAGNTLVTNYDVPGAGYEGKLEFSAGLGLIHSSIIMPQTYMQSDIYENTSTAVPYGMVSHDLKYGIWLTRGNYIRYHAEADQAWFTAWGTPPVMILQNHASGKAVSEQTSYGDGEDAPRMVAGFDHMLLTLPENGKPFLAGDNVTSVHSQENTFTGKKPYGLRTNPLNRTFSVTADSPVRIRIISPSGKLLAERSLDRGTFEYKPGFYGTCYLRIFDKLNAQSFSETVILIN